MSEVTGKAWDGKLFSRIMSYASPYKMLMVGAIALTVILAVVTSVRPIIFGYMVGSYGWLKRSWGNRIGSHGVQWILHRRSRSG